MKKQPTKKQPTKQKQQRGELECKEQKREKGGELGCLNPLKSGCTMLKPLNLFDNLSVYNFSFDNFEKGKLFL